MSFKLSAREREVLRKLGEAILPATDVLPVFGDRAIDQIETYLASGSAAELRLLFKTALHMVERGAMLRHLRPMSKLPPEKRAAYIERHWVNGALPRRLMFRLFGVMLKGTYFDDPAVYASLGLEHKKPEVKAERPRFMSQVTRAKDLNEDVEIEAEVVVIGTGAGGAAAALELASRGNAVVMIEEGDYFARDRFTGRGFEMQRLLYMNHGLTATVGNVAIPVPLGVTVGGSTTVNSGTCFRTPARTLNRWRGALGLTAYTPEHLEPYLAKVEAVFQVKPADAKYVGKNGEIIARGAGALGWSHGPIPRNAPDCDGQALCCFGCATGAKRSADISFVPMALEKGAQLLCRVKAERIILDGKRAAGVVGRSLDTGRKVRVKARAVVLSMGAFGTPRFLMRQGICNSSGRVGKNLSLHPATAMLALMDEPVEPQKSIPQGYMVDEFHEEGLLMEGSTLPLEMFTMMVPGVGRGAQEFMQNYRRISSFGVMVCDTTRGHVLPDKIPQTPLAFYWLNRKDFALMRRGLSLLARIYLAAGAREIRAMIHGWKPMRSVADIEENMGRFVLPVDVDIS
ncbi:MAG: GMC family oxidoreductase N-terminal domain-containing protein, partial [Deltaproteobacteria bacterium]|nr:GMC family oxidoreductase N-terminal domain-containing protein [Deltaproteobacteria bacterium]